ncbi:MerR family DNA-binding transcriptional regulator [Streptomyces sp. NBC_01618]|uniref:MerR family DNA-binding transcriptional regulator n=1 Tax=Streptomyces sp. NBC_01618 TaxID=2975900 RepID=UPI003868C016|nr:MerR family DNA-binding transcriptional regulator [Streptomyces sp. NBC_01618]
MDSPDHEVLTWHYAPALDRPDAPGQSLRPRGLRGLHGLQGIHVTGVAHSLQVGERLARRHGLSTQAVRNYEDAGIIPSAHRSRTGYRDCTATHAAGLAVYPALVPAFGYSTS